MLGSAVVQERHLAHLETGFIGFECIVLVLLDACSVCTQYPMTTGVLGRPHCLGAVATESQETVFETLGGETAGEDDFLEFIAQLLK